MASFTDSEQTAPVNIFSNNNQHLAKAIGLLFLFHGAPGGKVPPSQESGKTRGGGTGGALGARAPPLLGPKILKSALFHPEFPVDKVPQAPVPPHFSTRSSPSV